MQYTARHVLLLSTMRSSWQFLPMDGIGRDNGMVMVSPRCNCLSNMPASIRAAAENGGVLTALRNHTKGLCEELIVGIICRM